MHIMKKEKAEVYDTGHGEIIYKLAEPGVSDLTQHSIVLVEIAPLHASRMHYHPQVEETYYILAGNAKIMIDDETATLHPGELVAIPPGKKHKITNLSHDQILTFIATCATPWTSDCSVFLE